MWGILRIILLIATAVFLARIAYWASAHGFPGDWTNYLLAFGAITFFILNAIYLLFGRG
jgi:hypothetical protein